MSYLKLFLLICCTLQLCAQDYRSSYQEKTKKQFPNSLQDFYPEDTTFRITANYKVLKKGKIIAVPTTGTKIKEYKAYALLRFSHEGKKYQLTVYQPQPVLPLYKDLLFLPLKDATAPHETYGGGRYLDLRFSDFKEGKVTLDFNKLYNPYCAFSEGWNCPIPPKNNTLSLAIKAGEKIPLKTEYDQD
jgi:uncharacterized protein (DUF1684 family)